MTVAVPFAAVARLIAVVLAALALCVPAHAAAPAVQARAYVVQSTVDGHTLAARESTTPRAMASITKLMTALVALQHVSLDDIVTVPAVAASVGESSIELRAGQRVPAPRPPDRDARAERQRRGHGARGRRGGLGAPVRHAHEPRGAPSRARRDPLSQPAWARPAGPRLDGARHRHAPAGGAPQSRDPAVRRHAASQVVRRPRRRVDRQPARQRRRYRRREDRSHGARRVVAGRIRTGGWRWDHGSRPRLPQRGAARCGPRGAASLRAG